VKGISDVFTGALVGVMLVMAGFNLRSQPVKTLLAAVVFSVLAAVLLKVIRR